MREGRKKEEEEEGKKEKLSRSIFFEGKYNVL